MLNLSDKELDRLSREAANEHEPGDQLGPGAWEKLELRLDRELGRISPNPFRAIRRGFRRFPLYYAPAMILLVGISYYIIRSGKGNSRIETSGSPPLTAAKPAQSPTATIQPSSQDQNKTYNSTSTLEKDHGSDRGEAGSAPNAAPVSGSAGSTSPAGITPSPESNTSDSNSTLPHTRIPRQKNASPAINDASTGNSPSAINGASAGISPRSMYSNPAYQPHNESRSQHTNKPDRSNKAKHHHGNGMDIEPGPAASVTQNDLLSRQNQDAAASSERAGNVLGKRPANYSGRDLPAATTKPRELEAASVRAPGPLAGRPHVDDSSLRNFAGIDGPIHANAPYHRIKRNLQFGLLAAPDFSSVNSLAGDRPGSSIGLTVDYQFADRWYISTGLLFTRKNYSARSADYHAPPSFYWANNLRNCNLVKGTFNMLEIPLNLRYDFSTFNNTIFFASAGLSSYLKTNEDMNFYYDFFGRSAAAPFKYRSNSAYLFSAVNLSLGFETGISNSFSLLFAPYVKLPAGGSGMGFGQVRISSMGLNFGIKYAPIISRKRK